MGHFPSVASTGVGQFPSVEWVTFRASRPEVSVGTLDASLVHPREVLKGLLLSNSAACIVAHNHPSGDPTPSQEDIALTRRLYDACQLVGVPVLDHVIIGTDGRYYSWKENGMGSTP